MAIIALHLEAGRESEFYLRVPHLSLGGIQELEHPAESVLQHFLGRHRTILVDTDAGWAFPGWIYRFVT